jgi:hypothetical protein
VAPGHLQRLRRWICILKAVCPDTAIGRNELVDSVEKVLNRKTSPKPSECRRNAALVSHRLLFGLLTEIANFDLFSAIRQD